MLQEESKTLISRLVIGSDETDSPSLKRSFVDNRDVMSDAHTDSLVVIDSF